MNTASAPEIHVYCWDFKTGKDIEFDSMAHNKPQVAGYIKDFSRQFQQQRTDVMRALTEFEKRENHAQMDQLETTVRQYLSFVKGLYNSCGLIEEDQYMPGQFPLQYLRYAASFKWSGSLCTDGTTAEEAKKEEQVGIKDAVYESISMLFNLATAYQKCAAMKLANALDDDSLKEAYQLFAKMAGVYEYMKPLVTAVNQMKPILLDVQTATLDALIAVCMAQLQECAMGRLATKEDKELLIAKLCHDTSSKYGEARKYCESFTSDTWRHKERTDTFQKYCHLKEQIYLAKSYALMGHEYNKNEENGKAIFCCRKAVEMLKSIEKDVFRYEKKLDKRQSPRKKSMKNFLSEVQTYAAEKMSAFERENSMIYHDTVPASISESLPSQSMGKPVDFAEVTTSPFFDAQFYDMFGQRKPAPGQHLQSQMIAPPKKKKDCVIQ